MRISGFKMRGNRKRQADVHSAGISFHRSIEKFFHAGEIDDRIELNLDFLSGHAEDGAVQKDVLAPVNSG